MGKMRPSVIPSVLDQGSATFYRLPIVKKREEPSAGGNASV
jgi:hypothetical protein